MNNNILSKLIEISTPALGPALKNDDFPQAWNKPRFLELAKLLTERNGFYAFESALLVRPFGINPNVLDLVKWNEESLWLETYKIELPELFFFAEDLFGGQFAISGDEIVSFDPETGEVETVANSFDDWLGLIVEDYDYMTGYSLAVGWKKENGDIANGARLIPKQLFVLGGEFELDNLMLVGDVRGMRSRGFFATALVDIADGEQISFELVD